MNRASSLLISIFLLADLSVRNLALSLTRNRQEVRKTELIWLDPSTGASCLDGSPYVFQFTAGNPEKWTIHLANGKGACADAEECEALTKTSYGSSQQGAETTDCICKNYEHGHAPTDCTCVNLLYCDGSLFLGNRMEPQTTLSGAKLFSRGHVNLLASLDILLQKYGLDRATELMVTGQSSGGLSIILNLDSMAHHPGMPDGMKIRGMPEAGFTIDIGTCCDQGKCCYHPEYPDQCCYRHALSEVYEFHNMSGTVHSDCAAHYQDNPSSCLLSVYATSFTKTPMFIMNSKHDAWQLVQFEGLDFGGIYHQQAGIKESLETTKIHGEQFTKQLELSLQNTNHSAYITSCVCHAACGLDNSFFSNYFEGVWIGEKVARWYKGTNPESNLFIEDFEPNYDCDIDGTVQQLG